MKLDSWQEEILKTEGNIAVRSGRQVGKSTIISLKAAEFAVSHLNSSILIISHTERQAYLLFSKILSYLFDNHKKLIKKGKDRPTKSEIKLLNGSVIRCLPTGMDGAGIRGYTIDILIADEAAYIPDDVWPAVTPMLATTGGKMILLSTPKGKLGYFYERFSDPTFKTFHINTEEVAEAREEPQRSFMLENMKREQERMSKLQYAQEYLGEFIGGLGRLFPDELIKKCQMMDRRSRIKGRDVYLGVDIARMGGDESTFEILEKNEIEDKLLQIENITRTNTLITETSDQILMLERYNDFKEIGIDDGGMGVGVFDILLREDSTRSKIRALNNAKRNLNKDKTQKKKLLKEDMYMNLLVLMEKGRIQLLKDPNIFFSLASVQFERLDNGDLEIFGNYTHIAEGLIRAAWLGNTKSLNLYIDWI